jgi:hypothetical protein
MKKSILFKKNKNEVKGKQVKKEKTKGEKKRKCQRINQTNIKRNENRQRPHA